MIYIDASILLELYLERPRWTAARDVLASSEPKTASYLLAAEVPVVLRRVLSGPGDSDALARCLEQFDRDIRKISLVESLADVALRIRSDSRFARCRTLDAVHACTALLIREWTGQAMRVESFDSRLTALAAELNLH
jgi:predicted nucleic acid-binding protein